ncbi:MAG: anthranilate synthase component I [Bacteroidota bacterium]
MMTTFKEFTILARRGNFVPVCEDLLADTETPVSVYMKLRRESPYSFLFESVEGGEHIGRYSFIGFDPFMLFTIRGKRFEITRRHGDGLVLPTVVDPSMHPLEALKKIFSHTQAVPVEGLPRFSGGAVGYFGYHSVQLVEDIPPKGDDDIGLEDCVLMFYDAILVFDNFKRKLFIVSNGYIANTDASESELRGEYEKAVSKIERFKALLRKPVEGWMPGPAKYGQVHPNMTKEEFLKRVERIKQYIVEGDIFQVVLSQRFDVEIEAEEFDIYRMLRVVNPSPYMYFLQLDDVSIIGSSPETLVRVENGMVETRPIAGTRPRGVTPEDDRRLGRELLEDEKERAEHLMLVDLGRNDIGRISEFGSVRVNEFMTIERYSHVMHIVSNVQGKLRANLSPIDALYSCFPAGTLSGAPKIRAMEIIAELEPNQRGVYGGAIGYVDFAGNLDSCIAIRTIVVKNKRAYLQAGAGIVYDSVPEKEYMETLNKLAAIFKALELLSESQHVPSFTLTSP